MRDNKRHFFNNWKEDNNKNDGCKGCTGYLQGNGKNITWSLLVISDNAKISYKMEMGYYN